MRQLVYISSKKRDRDVEPSSILAQSRRNNAASRVTGLLFYDGKRFLQALEGEEAEVDATFARIQRDDRHHALVILSNRTIDAREFGEWTMAYNAPGENNTDAIERIARLTENADATVRATFEGFARVRRAA